jgi:hypothetical protein
MKIRNGLGWKYGILPNFFTEDVKKNHIFPQFLGYIAIYLVPVGGQLCVLGEYILLVFY